jgi:phosphatidylserine/phosphatidylglycerophosphate/cardiolipin synthase-like enzyme
MPNTSVRGRVVDESGAPRPGVEIRAYDIDPFRSRQLLGVSFTDASGNFNIVYTPGAYAFLAERNPDIQVELWQAGSLIQTLPEVSDVRDDVLEMGDIVLPIGGLNTSLWGEVIDESGRPVTGLVVIAFTQVGSRQRQLGWTTTGASGRYGIAYSMGLWGWPKKSNPDLFVSILDRVGVEELVRSPVFQNVQVPSLQVPQLRVRRALAEGWTVTGGSGSVSRLSTHNLVDVLVDNEAAFSAMIQAINGALTRIHLLQLAFDTDLAGTFAGDPPQPSQLFANALRNAALPPRLVRVRILLNQNVFVDDVNEVANFFRQTGVNVRAFPLAREMLHAKMLLVDGVDAFIIGSPFQKSYWDTPTHAIDEPRRGDHTPLHDVTIRLRGPAVKDLEDTFVELWNFRARRAHGGIDVLPPPVVFPSPGGKESVQIVRSIPWGVMDAYPNGEAGVYETYVRAIAQAEQFIYIEDQYFSCAPIATALKKALETKPGLEVIVLINENPDIPSYKRWQNERLDLLGYPNHQRLGVFASWAFQGVPPTLEHCYVHSKVAIVDDVWATIGTANLDGISQQTGDFALPVIGWRPARRNVEINAVVFDGVVGQPATGKVAEIRKVLWAEQLGLPPVALNMPPPGGWLALWRQVAAANVASLNGDPPTMTGRILPYSRHSKIASHLNDAGVNYRRFTLKDRGL